MRTVIRVLTIAVALQTAAIAAAGTIDLTSEPVHKLVGLNPGDALGWSLAVGDVDGDGAPELAAGAPGASGLAGAVYLLGIDELAARSGSWGDAAISIEHAVPMSRFGSTILFMDFDCDGDDELVVGAPEGAPATEIRTGQVFVFDFPTATSELDSDDAMTVITGDASGDEFGSWLASCDVDDDGRVELLVSAPGADHEGRPNTGVVCAIAPQLALSAESHRAASVTIGSAAGAGPGDGIRAVCPLDINGDGEMELAVGAHQFDAPAGGTGKQIEDSGAVYLLPASALAASGSRRSIDEVAIAKVVGVDERGMLGHAIASGDIDGDGADDMIISSHTAGRNGDRHSATGSAHVIFGTPGIEVPELPLSVSAETEMPRGRDGLVTLLGRSMWDIFGLAPLIADLNGDGFADLTVAAQFVNGFDGERQRSGEVYLYRGSLRSVVAAKGGSAERADAVLVGATGDAIAGAAVAIDVTGDGRPELVLGAPDASGLDEERTRRGRIYITPAELLRAR